MGGQVLVMCMRDGCRHRYRTTYLDWRLRRATCPRCHGWEAQLLEDAAA